MNFSKHLTKVPQPISEAEARRAAIENAVTLAKHGGDRKTAQVQGAIGTLNRGSNNKTYLAACIKRDAPRSQPALNSFPASGRQPGRLVSFETTCPGSGQAGLAPG